MKQVQFKITKKHKAKCAGVSETKAGYFHTPWCLPNAPLVYRGEGGTGRGRISFAPLQCIDSECGARALIRMSAIEKAIGAIERKSGAA